MSAASELVSTPLGELRLHASEVGLTAIHFPSERAQAATRHHSNPILDHAKRELIGYFYHGLTRFTVPLDWQGTPFQQAV
jgi:methylated-DNA-[protein]-cysteine S-methyltransferase